MSEADHNTVRIFVGTDRSQMIGYEVLKYSIQRFSSLPVSMQPMLNLDLPEPNDKRQVQRTGFSFSRFAIPRLAGYRGKAIYMDADMQVFCDIRELWEIPFNGTKVVIQEEIPSEHQAVRTGKSGRKRIKQCSVMMLDCEALDWLPEEIIAGLDGAYTYPELMADLCILHEDEISYDIPFRWNSLEHWDETTCLIHYTDMNTQPWVSNANPFGYIWVRELKRMLDERVIDLGDVREEIARGYARPSLETELLMDGEPVSDDPERRKMLDKVDHKAGFEMHKEVHEAQRRRKQAEKEYLERIANKQAQMRQKSVG